jgi:protease IV
MKTFFQVILANLVTIALVVIGALLLGGGLLAALGPSVATTVSNKSVLLITLDDLWSDRRDEVEPSELFTAVAQSRTLEQRVVLRDALDAIRKASSDEQIVGIVMLGDGTTASLPQLTELRETIDQFRTSSKKPVHAFFTNPSLNSFVIGTAASRLTMSPGGTLEFGGLGAVPVFFAGALEKVGVKVDVVKVGRYKSAVEQYTQPRLSPEARLQLSEYLQDQWRTVLEDVSQARALSTVALQGIADRSPLIDADTAKAMKLIDRVAHFDSVLVDLAALTGTSAEAAQSTTVGTIPAEIPHVSVTEYVAPSRAAASASRDGAEVALVVAEGDIVDGYEAVDAIAGDALARTLRDLRRSDDVRAVVLRINSPGGSATASETIEREVALLAKSRPVVVSMGQYAASGGYYIAAPATRILAERSTLTGSIGIFGIIPNLSGLAAKLGVTTDTVGTARLATQFDIVNGLSPEVLGILQARVNRGYELFLTRVSEGRKLPMDSVRAIAEGRVWSGEDAKPIGLVDEIGGLTAAITTAGRLAKLGSDYTVVEYPRVRSTRELLGGIFSPTRNEPMASVSQAIGPLRSVAEPLLHHLRTLGNFNDPRHLYARLPFTLAPR